MQESRENNNSKVGKDTDILSPFDEFLEDNQHLFLLIGVFGPVSVYLSNIEISQPEHEIPLADLSMFFGLGITTFLSLIIVYKIAVTAVFNEDNKGKLEKIPFLVFGVLFLFFISIIFTILLDYRNVIAMLVVVGSIILGLILPFLVYVKAEELDSDNRFHLQNPVVLLVLSGIICYILTLVNYFYLTEYGWAEIVRQNKQMPPDHYHLTAIHSFVVYAAASSGLIFVISIPFSIYKSLKMLYSGSWSALNRFLE